jgi:hypothetical protein
MPVDVFVGQCKQSIMHASTVQLPPPPVGTPQYERHVFAKLATVFNVRITRIDSLKGERCDYDGDSVGSISQLQPLTIFHVYRTHTHYDGTRLALADDDVIASSTHIDISISSHAIVIDDTEMLSEPPASNTPHPLTSMVDVGGSAPMIIDEGKRCESPPPPPPTVTESTDASEQEEKRGSNTNE